MDKMQLEELNVNLEKIIASGVLPTKSIYFFGHCNATEKAIDLLLEKKFKVKAILDNNK